MIKYKIINKFKTNKENKNKINIEDKKIIFLGCGSIAKCCLYYLSYFFIFDYKNIIIIDKLKREKDYPVVKYYLRKKSTFLVKEVTEENYVEFFNSLQLKEKDIELIKETEKTKSVIELVNSWLERMPFHENEEDELRSSY